jgi:hypothetical protein
VAAAVVYLRLRVHLEQELLVKVMTAAQAAPVVLQHRQAVLVVGPVALV